MKVADLVALSLRQLAKNKLRSLLTVLGIVIGIAAVTVMVSIGQGGQTLIQNQFRNLGSNVLVVYPTWKESSSGVRQGRATTLTADDAKAIAEECPAVARPVRSFPPAARSSAATSTGNRTTCRASAPIFSSSATGIWRSATSSPTAT